MSRGKFLLCAFVIFLCVANVASAAESYSQSVTLEPGWNVVSTPRLLDSHEFSIPETLANFAIYTLDPTQPSGWATMASLGQTEFVPLYGYFINNKTGISQTLTFNYQASTTPNERLFERTFTEEGWYSFGTANPSYAKTQGDNTTDTDNPDHILNSLLGATSNYDSVVDFTDASFSSNPDSVALLDPWNLKIRSADVSNTTEINSLNDFRETKGYAIFIKTPGTTLSGFQNADVPECADGIDNDEDDKVDHPIDFGCTSSLDTDESNLPAGTITITESSAYANQTTAVPQAAYKIGEYQITAGGSDTFAIGVIGLGIIGSTTTVAALENIYFVLGATTSPAYATGTEALLWFGEEGDTLSPDSSTSLQVYASLPSSMSSGETIATQLVVAGISYNSGDIVETAIVNGQTITASVGLLTVAVDASTPISALVVGNSTPKVASFKFSALNDSFTITELTAKVASMDGASAVTELVFKNGATELTRVPFVGLYATATGLSVVIPSNSNKVIDVYASLGGIGTGLADSGANVGVTLSGYGATNSGGGNSLVNATLAGNNMYVFKTKPTITNVALPTTVMSPGSTQTVAKFTITADAGGTLSWRKLILTVATSTPTGSLFVTGYNIYDAANESTVLANTTPTVTTGATVTFISTSDQQVSGSKTYVVKATIGGAPATGASASHYIATGATAISVPDQYAIAAAASPTNTFVWSDESVVGHSATTVDWVGDFLVKNLPTDSQALVK